MTNAIPIWRDFTLAKKLDHGPVLLCREDGSHIGFVSIRAGLSWPSGHAPGYFVLLGQRTQENARGRCPLLFIAEGEERDPQTLFLRLSNEASTFYCGKVYADLSPKLIGMETLFSHFKTEHEIQGLSLLDAPYKENFQVGLTFIKKWASEAALEIEPESILAGQLSRIPRGELGESPEAEWYAVNALRFVLAAFEKVGRKGGMTEADVERLDRLYAHRLW